MEIKLNDMLVFEDESGKTYQDCVCEIIDGVFIKEIKCNNFSLRADKINEYGFILKIKLDEKDLTYNYISTGYKLKEIWHKVDKDTYKKVWSKIEEEEKLTGKNLFKTYKIFKEQEFEELETYRGHSILKASLNHHNSEYVIKDLGFDTRFSSLGDCKKYIKLFLDRESLE